MGKITILEALGSQIVEQITKVGDGSVKAVSQEPGDEERDSTTGQRRWERPVWGSWESTAGTL